MKICVIGIGAVGYPLYKALQYYHDEVYCFDKVKKCDEWSKIVDTDIAFVCVPTNPKPNGRLDMSIVDKILNDLSEDNYEGVAVIKSTLGLGYIDKAIKRYYFKIIVFPEWLYAANAFPDTLKPEMTVVGFDFIEPVIHGQEFKLSKNDLIEFNSELRLLFDVCKWHKKEDAFIVEPEEAVMIKLTANSLASTKISFANQIDLICKEYKIDSNIVMNAIKCDPRCSPRYLTPGRPFGGHCLVKDTDELKNSIIENHLLNGVCEINKIFSKSKQ